MLLIPNEKYDDIYTTDKPVILLTGGRGSGKTTIATVFLKDLSYTKNQVILFTRYTMTSAEKSIIPAFTTKMMEERDFSNFKVTINTIINNVSKSKLLFAGIKVSSGNQVGILKGIEGLSTFVVDEGQEWQNEEDYDAISLSIRTKDAKNRTLIVMNPCDLSHFVFKKYIKKTHRIELIDGVEVQISTHPDVCHIHTTYLDNINNLSDKFLNEILEIKKTDFDKYSEIVIGKWADGNKKDCLFRAEAINDIYTNKPTPSGEKYIVCDAARYGRDYCVTMVFKGWEVLHISVLTKSDVHDILNDIEQLRGKFQVSKSKCLVDGDGVGADTVKMGGYKSFNGGNKPIGASKTFDNYKNLKTQCAFHLAENVINKGELLININNGTVSVDGVFGNRIKRGQSLYRIEDLINEDLNAIRYANVDKEGKKAINSKEEQKGILGRSPDFFDTLNMKCYFDLMPKSVYL